MNLSEWRKERAGTRWVLPSGLEVTLRKVTMLELAERGQVPTPLVGAVNTLLNDQVSLTVENVGQYMGPVNLVVQAALVDPPVAEQGDEEVVGIGELSIKDRLAIYEWVNAEVSQLIPFRD